MKKSLALLLIFALTLALAACGGETPPETLPEPAGEETVTAATAPETEKTAPGKEYPAITETVTRADIRAIPVATADMTEDELRDICVRYMTLMQSVVWTPDASLSYFCDTAASSDRDGNINLPAGNRYGGMPYSKAAQDLDGFLDYLDERGVLAVSQYKSNAGSVVGNHCSTSCFWAWGRVSASLHPTGNRRILPAQGFSLIAPCTLKEELSRMSADRDTRWICDSNGEQTMYRAYANFKPASGMITWKDGTTGHMRMAVEAPTVVKNPDGSIDGNKSFVLVNEQVSTVENVKNSDGAVRQIGKNRKQYTFLKLFTSGYVPFEIPELCGKAAVQKAEAVLEKNGDGLDALLAGKVTANYMISRLGVTFRTSDGATAYEAGAQGYGIDTSSAEARAPFEMDVKKAVTSASLTRKLKKGETYTVILEARLANGETLTLFEGSLLYQ